MHETTSNLSVPTLIYFAMGIILARIMLDGTSVRGFKWLQWLQFLIDASRIVLLWPLVLFLEKFEAWLNPVSKDEVPHDH